MAESTCSRCGSALIENRLQCPKCGMFQVVKHVPQPDQVLLPLSKAKRVDRVRYKISGPGDPFGITDGATLDEIFGGGIVDTSVTLIAGEPGAGKSTLCVQLAGALVRQIDRPVVYVGTEEAPEDILDRAERLMLRPEDLDRILLYPLGCEVDLLSVLEQSGACGVFLDSIQGLTQSLDHQVEIARGFKRLSAALKMPSLIMCQVTKDLDAAGLKALQHEVDADLRFTTYEHNQRTLEPMKNRNGSTDVVCDLLMTDRGLIYDEGGDDDDDDDEDE